MAVCVRARVPEKQGLKLVFYRRLIVGNVVRARVPEKQGLKLFFVRQARYDDLKSGREFQKNKD